MTKDTRLMPRRIAPELVEIGDDIEVTMKPERGLVTSVRGKVAKQIVSGNVRYLLTADGATILAWEPNTTKYNRVVIHSREVKPGESLFEPDILEETKRRIA